MKKEARDYRKAGVLFLGQLMGGKVISERRCPTCNILTAVLTKRTKESRWINHTVEAKTNSTTHSCLKCKEES